MKTAAIKISLTADVNERIRCPCSLWPRNQQSKSFEKLNQASNSLSRQLRSPTLAQSLCALFRSPHPVRRETAKISRRGRICAFRESLFPTESEFCIFLLSLVWSPSAIVSSSI